MLFQYSENKSYCEDLTEGKFSFPIIHAIQNHKGDNQVLRILLKRNIKNQERESSVKTLRSRRTSFS